MSEAIVAAQVLDAPAGQVRIDTTAEGSPSHCRKLFNGAFVPFLFAGFLLNPVNPYYRSLLCTGVGRPLNLSLSRSLGGWSQTDKGARQIFQRPLLLACGTACGPPFEVYFCKTFPNKVPSQPCFADASIMYSLDSGLCLLCGTSLAAGKSLNFGLGTTLPDSSEAPGCSTCPASRQLTQARSFQQMYVVLGSLVVHLEIDSPFR